MFALTNAHARKARRLFLELEGVDIYSAAGIATASLIKAVEEGKIAKDAVGDVEYYGRRRTPFQGG